MIFFLISCSIKKDNIIYDGTMSFWTKDVSEIELVMSYVMNTEDYRKLKRLDGSEKIIFLDNYWKTIDPDISTYKNELFDEP